MNRVRRPETVRLELAGGDYLIVKKHLTSGEDRAQFARMLLKDDAGRIVRDSNGRTQVDPVKVGPSLIVAYLLDWSIVDPDGVPIRIAGEPESVLASALDNLDVDSYREIHDAISQHDDAMAEERAEEKKILSTGQPSPAI